MNVQKSYCTTPCFGVGGGGDGVDKMLKFYVEVFLCDGLLGELSCTQTGLVVCFVTMSRQARHHIPWNSYVLI